ncbi:ABC transporter permease [Varunaivibrio sulfuroxidans]|uniref:Nitrate/nitrite transport system permease protein n=1 Tax=Varunaivibrio sulfuroxidans TaxID=1773489 RepID=A0A4R3JCX3_9PROT|nr:ABC transporter permease [Varunaivibrio sulfuroxidans]TCS62530.1 nitrate/nitrite transport system permease protein [Varunaivibrio sulfuroxidans]WES30799.1 ABC transporter permease [Varunaivibrio sulfuroxidans]
MSTLVATISRIAPFPALLGEISREQAAKWFWRSVAVPVIAFAIFLGLWQETSKQIVTSLGTIPGPVEVVKEAHILWADHLHQRAKEAAFDVRQEKRNAAKLAENPNAVIKWHAYTGKPTYIDQIFTSIKTVFAGFLLGTIIAIPLGIVCGLSPLVNAALNPLIQIFKPVSPLAWLPLVTIMVSALYVSSDPMFEKSFLTSAITVTLCSLWPTLINTSLGVASIDKDLMNVSRVLQLNWRTKVFKMILPSSLELIFTGLRLSLGVGWMVLIAAEMLAQNPGLGKFVWDEFQNGSSHSLARIMVAVFTIGIIGFGLDRIMLSLQNFFTFSEKR